MSRVGSINERGDLLDIVVSFARRFLCQRRGARYLESVPLSCPASYGLASPAQCGPNFFVLLCRGIKVYFFVAFPSITVVHLVPSGDISNIKLYDIADVIFIVNRPFVVVLPIFSSLVHVHVSPSTTPLESSNSPQLLNSR